MSRAKGTAILCDMQINQFDSLPHYISRYKGYNSIRFSYANEENNLANTRFLLPIQMYAKYLVGKR